MDKLLQAGIFVVLVIVAAIVVQGFVLFVRENTRYRACIGRGRELGLHTEYNRHDGCIVFPGVMTLKEYLMGKGE